MKKKIIFINNHFQYSDGTVRALIELVNNLDPNKFDITIQTIYKCDKRLKSELNNNIHLKKGFGFYFRGLDKIIRKMPLKWLYKRFVRERYDIEIAFQAGVPTLIIGNSLRKAVHIIWMHGYELFRDSFSKADMVVCCSKENALICQSEMDNEVKVTYCYNLVNDEKLVLASKESVSLPKLTKPFFISVGRLSPEKGYFRLINIVAELLKKGYKFSLAIVGDGPQKKTLKNQIERYKINNNVFLLGAQNNPHKITAKADIFVCSSHSEGYSTACTEAALLGIPIVTTNVSGASEIIEDCKCGVLCGADDESLKEGMEAILSNKNLINQWKEVMAKSKMKFSLAERKKALSKLFDNFYQMSEDNRVRELDHRIQQI